MEPITTLTFGAKVMKFITGPLFGRAMLIIGVVAALYFAISNYNEGIREEQMLRDQNAQLEQVIKDNNTLRIKLEGLERTNRDILIKLDRKNEKVIEKHTEVQKYLNSPDAKANDRDASPVLKETIGMLSEK